MQSWVFILPAAVTLLANVPCSIEQRSVEPGSDHRRSPACQGWRPSERLPILGGLGEQFRHNERLHLTSSQMIARSAPNIAFPPSPVRPTPPGFAPRSLRALLALWRIWLDPSDFDQTGSSTRYFDVGEVTARFTLHPQAADTTFYDRLALDH
jgi:hypothetical protein